MIDEIDKIVVLFIVNPLANFTFNIDLVEEKDFQ